jgi:antitoxin (DNA-binding transcriptional repressor) of toxin-antitoxin stability system
MKKMTVQEPRRRVKKAKPVTISKRGRALARLMPVPTPTQWPDFKSRLTKTRATSRPFRDIIDDLRQERV